MKLSIILGPLSAPFKAYCAEHKLSPSKATRKAIGKLIGSKPPDLKAGNPNFKAK